MDENSLQPPSANEAVKAFQVRASSVATWHVSEGCSPNNGYVPSLTPSFFPLTDTSTNPSVIHKPNPTTDWRLVPPKDKTNKPLCRPLSVKIKPPPPKASTPVVGSSTLVDTKNGSPVNTHQAVTGAWAKKEASVNVGAKTPPGLGCEFFSFTFCILEKCNGGLMVLHRG